LTPARKKENLPPLNLREGKEKGRANWRGKMRKEE